MCISLLFSLSRIDVWRFGLPVPLSQAFVLLLGITQELTSLSGTQGDMGLGINKFNKHKRKMSTVHDKTVYLAEPHHSNDGTYVVSHKIFLPNGDYELIPITGELYRTKDEANVRANELNALQHNDIYE